ncbi:hypothetical protein LTR86_005203 [Recurvomyces mirabilis]|nr:hypothetical protein LTR86_005203 [Recurvomyces mirabilis]
MAFANSRLGYHHPQRDGKHPTYFDEDDSSVLDPAILDADIMQSPTNAQYRKDSFANSNGVLSPAESQGWDQQYNSLPIDPNCVPPNYHEEHNAFVHPRGPHPPVQSYGHPLHGATWTLADNSGQCTSAPGLEFPIAQPQFEAGPYGLQRQDSTHGLISHQPIAHAPTQYNGPHGEHGFIPAPQVHTPMSPHSHQDWMGMAKREMDSRPVHKRMRPNSPSSAMMDFTRRDGIRKKNGRIDIPQERNIQTIDDLIDKTCDEDLLKELKQQKRLLRNREAALASRQRKKKHTEELEVREKGFSSQIHTLEKEVHELSIEQQQREDERQMLIHRLQESQRAVEGLQEEIRSLKVQHTEETSQLRRRVNQMKDQLALEAPAMSAAPSSTGFTDFNAEMEALNMGPHDWEDFFVVPDCRNDQFDDMSFAVQSSPVLEKRPSASTIVPSPKKKNVDNTSEQPLATGLLLMLLLCGAFVASKPPNARPSDLPSMPAEVQAAAPTVLKDLLASAGGTTHTALARRNLQNDYEPQPSAMSYVSPRANNRLEHMHRAITSPTRQQEYDQAYSLTTAQYASLTHTDYNVYGEPAGVDHGNQMVTSAPSSIATALAKMQQDVQQPGKPEVYSRSLLWDQLSSDVVRQFREIVRDHDELDGRQQRRRNGQQQYKAEQ